VLTVALLVLASQSVGASCMGQYVACMKEAADWTDRCVNGNTWHDFQCGFVRTMWELSCGLDFLRCSGLGR